MANHFRILQKNTEKNHMNGMKRQKDMTLKDELPRLEGAQYSGKEWRTGEIAPEGMKRLSQRGNNAKLWWST